MAALYNYKMLVSNLWDNSCAQRRGVFRSCRLRTKRFANKNSNCDRVHDLSLQLTDIYVGVWRKSWAIVFHLSPIKISSTFHAVSSITITTQGSTTRSTTSFIVNTFWTPQLLVHSCFLINSKFTSYSWITLPLTSIFWKKFTTNFWFFISICDLLINFASCLLFIFYYN